LNLTGDTYEEISSFGRSLSHEHPSAAGTDFDGGSASVSNSDSSEHCSVAITPAGPPNIQICFTKLKSVNPAAPTDKVIAVGGSANPAAGSLTTNNLNEFLHI
jgi:hypothetical protein